MDDKQFNSKLEKIGVSPEEVSVLFPEDYFKLKKGLKEFKESICSRTVRFCFVWHYSGKSRKTKEEKMAPIKSYFK